jgi:hypothetical protein
LGGNYDIDKLAEEKVGSITWLELQTLNSIPLDSIGTDREGLSSNSSFTYGRHLLSYDSGKSCIDREMYGTKRQTEEREMGCNKRTCYLYHPLDVG